MPKIITIGEPIVDFISTESGLSLVDANLYQRSVGGCPANIAVGLARLGCSVGVIGKIGSDKFGAFIKKCLINEGIDTQLLQEDPQAPTAIAFAALNDNNKPEFLFCRRNSAGNYIFAKDIDEKYFVDADFFMFSSLSLISESSREATFTAVKYAQNNGVLVAFDPQIRIGLWPTPELARELVLEGLSYANLMKANDDEVLFMSGVESVEAGSEKIWSENLKLMVITLGSKGCWYKTRAFSEKTDGINVATVDTTGAGDSFMAGLLYNLQKYGWPDVELSKNDWTQIITFANAAAALTTTKRGVFPALPFLADVEQFMLSL